MLTRLPSPSVLRRAQSCPGFTLMEVIIATGLGVVILGLVIATIITLTHSMVSVNNYFQLDSDSRIALDQMSLDIRNASTVTSISTNSLSMSGSDYQGNAVSFTYAWDGTNVWRTYNVATNTYVSLLLSNCSYFSFGDYTRVPQTNFTFVSAGGTNDTKLISVSWKCSRSILGKKLNSESMQTADIVIRN